MNEDRREEGEAVDWAEKFTHDVVEEMQRLANERKGEMIPSAVVMASCAFWMKVFNDGMGDDHRALMTLAWLVQNAPVTSVVMPDPKDVGGMN